MTILAKIKLTILTRLGYRNVNRILSIKYKNRHRGMKEAGARPIIVSGSQRSGTTLLAENICEATNARLLFEPMAMSPTYDRTRALALKQILTYSPALDEGLNWLLVGALPYNHSVDAIAKPRHYDRRLIKDLRLGFSLLKIAKAYPDIPIFHIVRHPLDAIRSHLKLKIRADHYEIAKNNVERITQIAEVVESHPWLKNIDTSQKSSWELELIEWCVENSAAAGSKHPPNLLVVSYENIVHAGKLPQDIWDLLQKHGIDPDIGKADLTRPSKTMNIMEVEAFQRGAMTNKYRDFFTDEQILQARAILKMAGLMQNDRVTVFGHEIG